MSFPSAVYKAQCCAPAYRKSNLFVKYPNPDWGIKGFLLLYQMVDQNDRRWQQGYGFASKTI